jgi:hypothetical protein
MTKPNRAADFLKNMTQDLPAPEGAPSMTGSFPPEKEAKQQPTQGRSGLKHIGGYCGLDTVEKVAVLRARLRLDNSGLITLAIDDLHRKVMAKRAFGEG